MSAGQNPLKSKVGCLRIARANMGQNGPKKPEFSDATECVWSSHGPRGPIGRFPWGHSWRQRGCGDVTDTKQAGTPHEKAMDKKEIP